MNYIQKLLDYQDNIVRSSKGKLIIFSISTATKSNNKHTILDSFKTRSKNLTNKKRIVKPFKRL